MLHSHWAGCTSAVNMNMHTDWVHLITNFIKILMKLLPIHVKKSQLQEVLINWLNKLLYLTPILNVKQYIIMLTKTRMVENNIVIRETTLWTVQRRESKFQKNEKIEYSHMIYYDLQQRFLQYDTEDEIIFCKSRQQVHR